MITMTRGKYYLAAGAALSVLLCANPVRGDATSDELKALRQQIEALAQKVQLLEQRHASEEEALRQVTVAQHEAAQQQEATAAKARSTAGQTRPSTREAPTHGLPSAKCAVRKADAGNRPGAAARGDGVVTVTFRYSRAGDFCRGPRGKFPAQGVIPRADIGWRSAVLDPRRASGGVGSRSQSEMQPI